MRNLNITLHGKAARVFPFKPDWSQPINETIEYRTNVMTALSGREQRQGLRQIPRRGFDYRVMANNNDARIMDAMMREWMDRWFAYPAWPDGSLLTTPVSAGAMAVNCDTIYRSFAEGEYAIFYTSSEVFEVVEVAAVTPSGLTLAEPTVYDWDAGSNIYPLILGHMGTSLSTQRLSDQLSVFNVAFSGSGDVTPSGLPLLAPDVMYDGLEVIMHSPNWRNNIQHDFMRDFRTLDNGFGPVGYYRKRNFTPVTKQFEWFLKTRQDIHKFKGFLSRAQGQLKPFWVPSWNEDAVIADTYAPNNAQLLIGGTANIDIVGMNTSYNRLRVIDPFGQSYFRTILAMSVVGDNTAIQLDSALPSKPTPDTGWRVQFLQASRLAVDRVVIPWVTNSAAIPSTAMRTIKL